MSTSSESPERIKQFYTLLAQYGLTGKTQPLNRQNQAELDALFGDEPN